MNFLLNTFLHTSCLVSLKVTVIDVLLCAEDDPNQVTDMVRELETNLVLEGAGTINAHDYARLMAETQHIIMRHPRACALVMVGTTELT